MKVKATKTMENIVGEILFRAGETYDVVDMDSKRLMVRNELCTETVVRRRNVAAIGSTDGGRDFVEVEDTGNYTGKHYVGEIVMHGYHECRVTHVWNVDGRNGISIIPTGGYGFEVDIYDEQL